MSAHCVLNTRPAHQAQSLTLQLEKLGHTAFELPLIFITPVLFQLPDLSEYHYIIFVSTNAVDHFFNQYPQADLSKLTTIAVGPATSKALNQHGVTPVITPKTFNSEGILSLPELNQPNDTTVLIVTGKNPKPLLPTSLKSRGHKVENIICYERQPATYNMDSLFPTLKKTPIDLVITTSQNNFVELINTFSQPMHAKWLHEKTLCVISDAMAQYAKNHGFLSIIKAENATTAAIIQKINTF